MESRAESNLKKSLKLIYVYAIAAGAIFCYIGYYDTFFIQYCGPATFLGFALMTAAILPIAFVYCELAPMFPSAGAELIYNTVGFNKHVGFFSAWVILAAWIAVPPTSIMIIVSWLNRVLGIGLSLTNLIIIGIICLAGYCLLSLGNIQIAGKVQMVMLVLAIAGCLISGVMFIFSGHWDWNNFKPFFQTEMPTINGIPGWFIGMALLITPFFGFETVPQLVEDGDFPIKNSTKAIWGSVVTCGVVYIIFFFCLAGVGSFDTLLAVDPATGAAYEFTTISFMERELGWTSWAVIYGFTSIICAIGTCLLGFWISTVRMIYAMGMRGFLPAAFAKVNKKSQPILPNIFVMVIGIFFLIMLNISTVMKDFFNLMSFGAAIAYAITMISAMRIAIKHPKWHNYKLKGGMFTRVLALIIALIIAYFCTLGQGIGSWICLAAYFGVGVLLWLWMVLFKWKKEKVRIITPEGEKEF